MQDFGRVLVVLGIVIAVVGVFLWKTGGLGPLGRLPGDITVRGEHSTFYFPIVTCILVSLVLTLLNWFFHRS